MNTRFVTVLAAMLLASTSALAAGPVHVSDAWIRWLPAKLPAGGYMQLHNDSDRPVELVGASSAQYGEVMLHNTVKKGEVMDMVHIDKVEIAPHGELEFKPGGYHLMLMNPKGTIEPGAKVPVTLKFGGGESTTVEFEVRKTSASDAHGMGAMDMKGMH